MRRMTLVKALALLTLPAGALLAEGPSGSGLTGLGPRAAYGQEEDPEVTNMAKLHYKLGQDAYNAGKYDVAIKELKKAYLLKRIPAILVNIGMTYRKTKDYEMAQYFFKKFLAEAPPDDKQRPNVEQQIGENEKERVAASQPAQMEPAKPAVEFAKPAVEPAKPAAPAAPAKADGPALAKQDGTPAGEAAQKPEGAAEAAPVASAPATEWAHSPIDAAPPKQPIDVRVQMPVMKGVKVKVFYRREGQASFDSLELKRRGNEKVARLPAEVASGRTFQYYVEARDAAGTLVKSSGSDASPNIVLIDPTARPVLAGAEAQEGDGTDEGNEQVAKAAPSAPKRDIENEAVSFNISDQQKAMEKLRKSLQSSDAGKDKKSPLTPVGWAGVGLLAGGAAALGGGIGMLAMAAGRADAVGSDSMCDTKIRVGGVSQCPHYGPNDDPALSRSLKPASSDYEAQGKMFNTVGIALTSVGGAVLATGGALLAYDLVKKHRAEQAAKNPAPAPGKKRKVKKVVEVEEPAAMIAPVISPGELGVVGAFRF